MFCNHLVGCYHGCKGTNLSNLRCHSSSWQPPHVSSAIGFRSRERMASTWCSTVSAAWPEGLTGAQITFSASEWRFPRVQSDGRPDNRSGKPPELVRVGRTGIWAWVEIKPPRHCRLSLFPCTRVPFWGYPIFDPHASGIIFKGNQPATDLEISNGFFGTVAVLFSLKKEVQLGKSPCHWVGRFGLLLAYSCAQRPLEEMA